MVLYKYKDFSLRKVEQEDIDLLYEWANDSLVRANSFNSNPIPYEDHKKWFENTLRSADRVQMILEKDNVPVGQIRLDIEGGIAEVGYSIAPGQRGKGYGTVICEMMIAYAREKLDVTKIVAQVKTNNIASKKCFQKNGFDARYEQFELIL